METPEQTNRRRVYHSVLDDYDQIRESKTHLNTDTIPELQIHSTDSYPIFSKIKHFLALLFPLTPQIAAYDLDTLIADLKSAATVSFVLIPQAIAFSSLARVDPVRALISAVFPLFVYALFGASRQLSVGPEALSSVLVGVAVTQELELFGGDPNTIASLLASYVGLFALLLSIIQAGFIDNILSGYLLTGFVLGVANLIIVEQIPGMFGIKVPHIEGSSTFQTFIRTMEAIPNTHTKTVIFGVSCLMFLLILSQIKAKMGGKYPWVVQIPGILILVVFSTILSFAADFKSQGIAIIGEFDNKIVSPSIPKLGLEQFERLLPNVVVITIVGYIESQSVTRYFGLKNGYFPSGDRELFALGISNFIGSFFGAYVTFGSLPRSRIQANSGGKTTLVGAMAALIVLILFTSLGSVLKFIPKSTLSAIVMMAGINLIEFGEIGFLMKMRNLPEICMFVFSWCMTVFVPVSTGILINLGVAALLILRKTTQVYLGLLGQLSLNDNTDQCMYVDVRDHPESLLTAGILAISIRGSLEFYNAGRLRRRIEMLLEVETLMVELYEKSQVTNGSIVSLYRPGSSANESFVNSHYDSSKKLTVILDFSRCDEVDTSAIYALITIIKTFQKQDKRIVFSGLSPKLQVLITKAGIDTMLKPENIVKQINDVTVSQV
ncbi:sulfate transporter family-domain-containing protein [Globomyces pollinis-pini]|nr:sulfate transporter family-domain-containing protein [Globomyces pollinis-pini]